MNGLAESQQASVLNDIESVLGQAHAHVDSAEQGMLEESSDTRNAQFLGDQNSANIINQVSILSLNVLTI